jgi:hypothetical protein
MLLAALVSSMSQAVEAASALSHASTAKRSDFLGGKFS